MVKILIKLHTYGSDVSHFHERNFLKVIDAITYLETEYKGSLEPIEVPEKLNSALLKETPHRITNAFKLPDSNLYVIEEVYPKLIRNSIQCLSCTEVLESRHRHDFVQCTCSNQSFVDGGLAYTRVGGVDLSLIKDLCEYE